MIIVWSPYCTLLLYCCVYLSQCLWSIQQCFQYSPQSISCWHPYIVCNVGLLQVVVPPQTATCQVVCCPSGSSTGRRAWQWGIFEGKGEGISEQTHCVFSELSGGFLSAERCVFLLFPFQAGWKAMEGSGQTWLSYTSTSPTWTISLS